MKLFGRFLILYIALVALFTIASAIAYAIPGSYTLENVSKSLCCFDKEGLRPQEGLTELSRRDNFTDVLMLGMSVSGNDSIPFRSAMGSPYYVDYQQSGDPRVAATKLVAGDTARLSLSSYARYWHGYMLPLRCATSVASLHGIRILTASLLAALLITALALMWKKRPKAVAISFAITILGLTPWLVATSLQFASVFYVMLIALTVLLTADATFRRPENLYLAFFAIGGCTSYVDLLTAPLITLGLPLAAYLYSLPLERKNRVASLAIVSWGCGYALVWASKWILASLFSPFDTIADAASNIASRTAGSLPDYITTSFIVKSAIAAIVLLMLIAAVVMLMRSRNRVGYNRHSWLLIIAALPPLWYLVLFNHTIIHYWYAWRSAGVSFFALLLFAIAMRRHSTHQSSPITD